MTMKNLLEVGTRKLLGKDFDVNKARNYELRRYSLLCDIGNNKAYEKRNELKEAFNNYIDKELNEIKLYEYITKGEFSNYDAICDIENIIDNINDILMLILSMIETPRLFKDYSRRQFITDLNYQLETNKNILIDELDKIYKGR